MCWSRIKIQAKWKWKRRQRWFFFLFIRSNKRSMEKIYLNICSHFRFCLKNWSVNGCYLLNVDDDDDDDDYWWNRYTNALCMTYMYTSTNRNENHLLYKEMLSNIGKNTEEIYCDYRHKLNAFLSFLCCCFDYKVLFIIWDFWQNFFNNIRNKKKDGVTQSKIERRRSRDRDRTRAINIWIGETVIDNRWQKVLFFTGFQCDLPLYVR